MSSSPAGREPVDVVLIASVRTMHKHSAPAGELYASPLFSKRREFAEESGASWFILSAMHGLVSPDQELEPYDMYLAGQPRLYLREWAAKVAGQLVEQVGPLDGLTIEIHAGSTYFEPLEPHLEAAGAKVRVPLRGVSQDAHLAWYIDPTPAPTAKPPRAVAAPRTSKRAAPTPAPRPQPRNIDLASTVEEAVRTLTQSPPALAGDFPWGREDLDVAGICAWWTDAEGATDLGVDMRPGRTLVYVGQVGATKWPAGTVSGATLMSVIRDLDLGGDIGSSTLRQTLAALLREDLSLQVAAKKSLDADSEQRLTEWMKERLSTTVWPTPLRDELGQIEDGVISELNAPLNLRGTASSELRHKLRQGRRALGFIEPG